MEVSREKPNVVVQIAKGTGPPQPQGRQPSSPLRRGGADAEEVRRRFQQVTRPGAGRSEAGGGDGAGGAERVAAEVRHAIQKARLNDDDLNIVILSISKFKNISQ